MMKNVQVGAKVNECQSEDAAEAHYTSNMLPVQWFVMIKVA
jgi:hypothetical protein